MRKEIMRRKIPALAVLMTGCMLFAAGCGAKQQSGTSAETKAETKTEAGAVTEAAREDSPEWVAKLKEAENAGQLFVVAGIGETTAYISMHEKDADGTWKQVMTTPGFIGKHGLGKEKEGDGMTPVGTYSFNYAFGIADDPGCAIPYQKRHSLSEGGRRFLLVRGPEGRAQVQRDGQHQGSAGPERLRQRAHCRLSE